MNDAKTIRRKMVQLAQAWDPDILDCGEISPTKLAEVTADELDFPDDELDDDLHIIWELAFEVSELYNRPLSGEDEDSANVDDDDLSIHEWS